MEKLLLKWLRIKMMMVATIVIIGFSACEKKSAEIVDLSNPELIHRSQEALTDVIVYDIFSPPVASRIYAYANIAAYEAMLPQYPEYMSFASRLNGFEGVTAPSADKIYDFHLSSIKAFLTVGKTLIFSEEKVEAFERKLLNSLKKQLPKDVFQNSLEYGNQVAKDVLAYAKADNYAQTRGFRYTIMDDPGLWKPTPPAYMDAVEPLWNKIRPFILDSANQFMPPAPTAFSLEIASPFYEEVMEVYEVGKNLSEEQKEIAGFWDCNPFVMHTVGHVMYATKKITPGGHWMGITCTANKKANADFASSVNAYARVGITLMDGFISCWDEKYRSSVVRPETIIHSFIDEDWNPLLQTPPFPEYPSGHSVVSTAVSIVLTDIYGENFSYIDSTEIKYGLPPRSFGSFTEAAQEAAISRLYAGIHYRTAIEHGMKQGKMVGELVRKKLNNKSDLAER